MKSAVFIAYDSHTIYIPLLSIISISVLFFSTLQMHDHDTVEK